MSPIVKLCGILCATTVMVLAQNKTSCLKYLNSCIEGSSSCCNYPVVSCLPDNKNGTSCLSIYDVVNLNGQLTGMAAFQPLLLNATGFLAETIDVNGENVYNTTKKFTPGIQENANPTPTTPQSLGQKTQKPEETMNTQKLGENVKTQEISTHKPH